MSAVPALSPPVAVERAHASPLDLASKAMVIVVPVALWFAPLPLDATIKHAIAVSSFMLVSWLTHALDHALTGLIGCYLAWALGVVKFEVAFSGFAIRSPLFLFGAILFGVIA